MEKKSMIAFAAIGLLLIGAAFAAAQIESGSGISTDAEGSGSAQENLKSTQARSSCGAEGCGCGGSCGGECGISGCGCRG